MKTFNAYIIEKLKVTKGSYITGDELFEFVMYGLKHYPEDELDVKSLKINAEYMHGHSHRIGSVDYIYYSDAINNPYGEKSQQEIISYVDEIIKFFIKCQCNAIVFACNTATA